MTETVAWKRTGQDSYMD